MKPGSILAQSVHAAFTFGQEHPALTNDWLINSNYICILEIDNEEKLGELLSKAKQQNIPVSAFIEPDYDNSLTAIALAPTAASKKLCSNLRLALKDKQ